MNRPRLDRPAARCLWAVTVLLLTAAPAVGQQMPLAAPGPRLSPPTFGVPSPALAPPGTVAEPAIVPDGGNHDFWIVTSRCCPQSPFESNPSCQLGYYRCGASDVPCRAGQAAFRAWLQPGVPVCILVHGSLTEWDAICADAVNICRWLRNAHPGAPVQFVFYSWPSEAITTILPAVDFAVLGHRSEFNGIYLAQFMTSLPPESPVSLVGHSLGSRVVASALHLMGGGMVDGYCLPQARTDCRPLRAVLTASAIDHHWLVPGEKYGCAVHRAEVMLNIRNREDFALALYPLRCPLSHRALGRSGLTPKDRALLGPLSRKIHELDVTCAIGSGHIFPRYYHHPEIAHAISPYITFTDAWPQAIGGGNAATMPTSHTMPAVAPALPAQARPPFGHATMPRTRTTGSNVARFRR